MVAAILANVPVSVVVGMAAEGLMEEKWNEVPPGLETGASDERSGRVPGVLAVTCQQPAPGRGEGPRWGLSKETKHSCA